MVKGKARAAGSFLGGIFNNPGIVIIGLVLGGLFIFRNRISEAFGSLGEGLGNINIQLPEIKLPDFPEINFPDFPEINFPDFGSLFENFFKQQQDFLSSLAGQTVSTNGGTVTIPPDTMIDPETGIVTSETPPIGTGGGATQSELDFAQARAGAFDTLFDLDVLTGTQIQEAISNIAFGDFPALNALIVSIQSLASDQLTPAQQFQQDKIEAGDAPPVQSFLVDDPTQQFGSGGLSFIGGSIFETQITGESTLSFIIDKLGVSASEAASIRAELRGFTQEEALFLAPKVITPFGTVFDAAGGGGGGVNVSDQQFAGLTPQQIFLQLTGGNISNF